MRRGFDFLQGVRGLAAGAALPDRDRFRQRQRGGGHGIAAVFADVQTIFPLRQLPAGVFFLINGVVGKVDMQRNLAAFARGQHGRFGKGSQALRHAAGDVQIRLHDLAPRHPACVSDLHAGSQVFAVQRNGGHGLRKGRVA